MRLITSLTALAALTASSSLLAQSTPPVQIGPVSPELAAEFIRPHEQIDIGGGRRLNLFCLGSGEHTVIFDSGLSDWSSTWALVQPEIAQQARACSYDRGGLGYSDPLPSETVRTPFAIVSDLRALLEAANITEPVILVGHSLGGFNMKLFAALYPEEVAGVVLVDPSEDRSEARVRFAEAMADRYGPTIAAQAQLQSIDELKLTFRHFADCRARAGSTGLDPASEDYRRCTDPPRARLGEAILAERVRIQQTPAYQQAQELEFADSVYGDRAGDEIYARLFSGQPLGNRPLIVLTAGEYDPAESYADDSFRMWNLLHDQTAALSARGLNRLVPGSRHNIQVLKPEAVIEAIREVLAALE